MRPAGGLIPRPPFIPDKGAWPNLLRRTFFRLPYNRGSNAWRPRFKALGRIYGIPETVPVHRDVTIRYPSLTV